MAWKTGRSYSTDLRSRVPAAIDGGRPAKTVAALFQVSVSYIYKALGRRGLARKNSRAGRRSRTGPTSPSGGSTGGPGKAR